MQRVVETLDLTHAEFAKKLGVRKIEVQEICGYRNASKSALADIEEEEIMNGTLQYVDVQIGKLMSVRYELERKLQNDRKRRLARRLRIETR